MADNSVIKQYNNILKRHREERRVFDSRKSGPLSGVLEILKVAMYLNELIPKDKKLIILGIGSPDMMADFVGPCTGLLLKRATDAIYVYGTSYSPVDASNINEYFRLLNERHKDDFIIAIDSCTFEETEKGKIVIKNRPLSPGIAIDRDNGLAPMGDISIMGIVGKDYEEMCQEDCFDLQIASMPDFIVRSLLWYLRLFRDEPIMDIDICTDIKQSYKRKLRLQADRR